MTYPNLNGKVLAASDAVSDSIVAYMQEKSKSVSPSIAGTIPFVSQDGSRQTNFFPLINVGNFCTTDQEVAAAKERVVSFKDVFTTWKRFSHRPNTTPPATPSELENWSYDEATDSVYCTVNSVSYIGIVSREKYGNWELEAYLSSSNGDDDTIGIVLGFVTDQNGVERTLSLTRGPGGNSALNWGYSYNLSNARTGLTTQYINSDKRGLLKWGSGNYGANAAEAGYTNNANGGWRGLGRCKVHVKREGNVFTCRTTEFELFDPTMAYVEAATIVIDLNNHPEGEYFKGACAYGYSCSSQDRSKWQVLKFVGDTRVIYDLPNRVTHIDDGSGWKITTERSLEKDFGNGKLLYNRFSGKLFYVESPTEYYHLNGAAW